MTRFAALFSAAVLCASGPAPAGPATAPAGRGAAGPAGPRESLRERDRLLEEVLRLRRDGKLREAVASAEQMLRVERGLSGDDSRNVAVSLELLAGMRNDLGEWEPAKAAWARAAAIREKLSGPGDGPGGWRVVNDLRAAADVDLRRALTPAQKQRLAEADDVNQEATRLYRRGDYPGAAAAERRAVDARQEVLGPDHPDTATALNNLALMYQAAGRYPDAEPLLRRALAINEKALGSSHPDTTATRGNLAELYKATGDYAAAEPLLRQSLEAYRRAWGPEHPDTALALNNLAGLYQMTGDLARAEPLLRRALAIREKSPGPDHPDTATTLNNLAELYKANGDYARAEPLLRRSLDIREKALGAAHPDTALALNNLAELYQTTGDYARAEPLLRRALEVREKVLGPGHPDTAAALSNLALLYRAAGDFASAEPLLRRALAVSEKALGRGNPGTAVALNNLALTYQSAGDYAAAEPLLRRSLEVREKALGPGHPDTATALNNLGLLYHARGDYAAAEPLLRRALEIDEKALGRQHPATAAPLSSLASLKLCTGEPAEAEAFAMRAVDAAARQAELTAAVQSERQQLACAADLRYQLDGYLSAAAAALAAGPGDAAGSGDRAAREERAARAYERVLRWKGAVSARQRAMRAARRAAANDPEAARRFAELERSARELANLASAAPAAGPADAYRRRVEELSDQVERLQTELAGGAAGVGAAADPFDHAASAENLRRALPPGVALVDLLEYARSVPPPGRKGPILFERRLAAFVLRREGPVAWVDLGPVEPVDAAVDLWRSTLGRPGAGADAGAELRRRVWEPLAKDLAGAGVVLVSPDGPLCRFPLAALPGGKPGTYLIEDVALATVAVPSLLPQLLAGPAGAGNGGPPSLLVVGDVDYDADPGGPPAGAATAATRPAGPTAPAAEALATPAPAAPPVPPALRGLGQARWPGLEATGEEADEVRAAFARGFPDARADALTLAGATESAARAAMPAHRFLHLATHGFFADPSRRSALAPPAAVDPDPRPAGPPPPLGSGVAGRQGVSGFHPGLLSGLVLSGANRRAEAGSGADDGILTALEVQELDLSGVDLAVLSACETGLGASAGGEGLLGLQRAFQVAGARTVVASLWQVPDRETRQLMGLFYRNLWEKKMTRLQALRQAQVAMLRRDSGGSGPDRGLRRDGPDTRPAEESGGRLPPAAWAAFVLSGEWR